jgi:hypothetical protein
MPSSSFQKLLHIFYCRLSENLTYRKQGGILESIAKYMSQKSMYPLGKQLKSLEFCSVHLRGAKLLWQ